MAYSISFWVIFLSVFCLLPYHNFSLLTLLSRPAGASSFSSPRHLKFFSSPYSAIGICHLWLATFSYAFYFLSYYFFWRSLILILKYFSYITFVSSLLVSLSFLLLFIYRTQHWPHYPHILLFSCCTCTTDPHYCLPILSQSSLRRLAASEWFRDILEIFCFKLLLIF